MTLPEFDPQTIEEDSEYSNLPGNLVNSLHRYVQEGRSTGHFLTAILENDLKGAVDHADSQNRKLLDVWVKYLYNRIPHTCWGSKEKVKKWRSEVDGS